MEFKNAREYALWLLNDCGCKLDCYKGEYAKHALKDMIAYNQDGYPGLPFPVVEIANALIEIGNEQPDEPVVHKPYLMVYSTDSFDGGIEFDSFGAAVYGAEDTYILWMQEMFDRMEFEDNGIPHPTEEQIDDWDYMYYNCYCYITEWDAGNGCYYDSDFSHFLTDEQLNNIGWMEWSEIEKQLRGSEV